MQIKVNKKILVFIKFVLFSSYYFVFEYFPILFYKDIFSANFKKICYTFAGTENFGKSETAAKMADCLSKDCCHSISS